MRLATKFGVYSVVQKQPPDDGDAAVYQVRARFRDDLEKLLRAAGFQHEISTRPDTDERYSILATQQEIFEIMSTLTESIDYDTFEAPLRS